MRESLLKYSFADGILVPHFLDERDHPWLSFLIMEYKRFTGRRRSDLDARLQEPLPFSSPSGKRELAIYVLNQFTKDQLNSPVLPKKARMVVFGEACRVQVFSLLSRNDTLLKSAKMLGIEVGALESSLLADLPGERQVLTFDKEPSAQELALQCNLLLAQGLVFRATQVEIRALAIFVQSCVKQN